MNGAPPEHIRAAGGAVQALPMTYGKVTEGMSETRWPLAHPAGARAHGDLKRTAAAVLAAVTATALAGYGLAWLRFRSESIAAPAIAHASLNGAAYLAARFVVRAAS
jgi:membrane protease YdiL (CAAX protease family)